MKTTTDSGRVLQERVREASKAHAFWGSRFLSACRSRQVARRDLLIFLSEHRVCLENVDRLVSAVAASVASRELRRKLAEAPCPFGHGVDPLLRELGHADSVSGIPASDHEVGARFIKEAVALCSCEHGEGAAALLFGFLEPIRNIHEVLKTALVELGVSDEALRCLDRERTPTEAALEAVLMGVPDDDPTAEARWTSAAHQALGLLWSLYEAAFKRIQLAGVSTMLERIQARESLLSGPLDQLVHRADAKGVPLYHNEIAKLGIDFTVDSLAFRPEVLEPRIVRIPPKKNNERHRHAHETVFYIIAGTGRVMVEDSPIEVAAGDIVFVPRWAMHQSQNTGDAEMQILAVTDFGLTGKTFVGDYTKTSRMMHSTQAGNANWRVLRDESKATEDFLAPLSVAYGTNPEVFADPYPLYERARSQSPVYFSERFGSWFLTRYEDVNAALREQRLSSKRTEEKFKGLDEEVTKKLEDFRVSMRTWMPFMDPPEHTTIRQRLNRFFSGVACDAARPRIRAVANKLVDAIVPAGRSDLVVDFCSPLHFSVLSDMLFGEEVESRLLRKWSMDIWHFVGAGAPTAERAERCAESWALMTDYVRERVLRRKANPQKDIVSALFKPDESGTVMPDEMIVANCVLLLSVGHEATWDAIGNCVFTLLRNPAAKEELMKHKELLPAAVEELLRYQSPVLLVARKAAAPLQICGKQIEESDFLMCMIGAANRDPAQFPEPDKIDFHRNNAKSLATGQGIHHCIGGTLGKVECQVALEVLLERLPNLRLATDRLEWKQSLGLGGVLSLPVTFDPASA